MKKYYLSFIIVILIIVSSFGIYLSHSNSGKNIHQLYPYNNSSISKIIFYDGRGVKKSISIQNKNKINEFLGYIDKYEIGAQVDDQSVGWIYSCVFYNKENAKILTITFGNTIIINNKSYKVLKNNLSPNDIEKFLKSAY